MKTREEALKEIGPVLGLACSRAHEDARAKGWWEALESEGRRKATVDVATAAFHHFYVSQAVEDARRGNGQISRTPFSVSSAHSSLTTGNFADPLLKRLDMISKLALIHSEVSEALQEVLADRIAMTIDPATNKPEGAAVELIDAVIRCFDLLGSMGVDVADIYETKTAFNATRPHRHGGRLV